MIVIDHQWYLIDYGQFTSGKSNSGEYFDYIDYIDFDNRETLQSQISC